MSKVIHFCFKCHGTGSIFLAYSRSGIPLYRRCECDPMSEEEFEDFIESIRLPSRLPSIRSSMPWRSAILTDITEGDDD